MAGGREAAAATLTVVAGNLHLLLARRLPHYETPTPDNIWRHFLDATGTLHISENTVTCALNLRSYRPSTSSRLRRPRNLDPVAGRPHRRLPPG